MATVGGALLSFGWFGVGIGHGYLAINCSIGQLFDKISLFNALMCVVLSNI